MPISASDNPWSTGIECSPALPVTPTIADLPSWPIQFSGKLRVGASSRLNRFVFGIVVDNPKPPKHEHQVEVRLNVEMPLPPAEVAELVVQDASRPLRLALAVFHTNRLKPVALPRHSTTPTPPKERTP